MTPAGGGKKEGEEEATFMKREDPAMENPSSSPSGPESPPDRSVTRIFQGIENRPHVIRGARLNIKKVYGNRHFPVDTLNPIF